MYHTYFYTEYFKNITYKDKSSPLARIDLAIDHVQCDMRTENSSLIVICISFPFSKDQLERSNSDN